MSEAAAKAPKAPAVPPKPANGEQSPDAASSKKPPDATPSQKPPDATPPQKPPANAARQPKTEESTPDEPAKPDAAPDSRQSSGWVNAAKSAAKAEEPIRSEQQISIKNSTAGQTTIANVLNQFAAPTTEVMFSAGLASRLGDAAERKLRAVVTLDSDFAAAVKPALDRQRAILLSGAAQSGKGTVAKYLAAELADREKLTNETYVVGPLESRVRILPRELATDENFGSRVTIFEDAFEYGNKDLLTFFRSDSAAWEELRTSLARNNAYFIFTTSLGQMNAIRDRLRVSCFEVAPWPELVATAMERKLAWLESQPDGPKEKLQQIRDHCDQIAEKLQTIPRVASMMDDYIGGGAHFDAVLERYASVSPSLLDDLQTDVDAWCFALTLAMTETADEPLPWSAFERLRSVLTTYIKGARELVPRRSVLRRAAAGDHAQRSVAAWLSDKPLLTRCQAVFRKDASGARDVVSFADPSCGRGIRKSLLDHHRRLLLMLAPFLRKMAEGIVTDVPASLCLIAAHTLGRIGTIDPPEISLPLLMDDSEWVSQPDSPLRILVGPFVRGALATDNEWYRASVLDALSRLAGGAAQSLDVMSTARLLTAIDAYSQLGNHPGAKPMVRFREIAARHCVPALKSAYEHFVEVDASNRAQLAARSQKAVDEAREHGSAQHALAAADLERCDTVALPLARAIARLCHDDIQALTAMRDWLSVGGAEMRLLVPYMFLVYYGIADALEYFASPVDGTDGSKAINAVVFAAAASRQSQHDVAAFLCDIYAAIGSSPLIAIQQELETRLADFLTGWVATAAPAPQFRHGMEELFGTLAAARGGFMRRWLFALIRKPAFTESEEMKAFSSAARRQMDE